MRLNPVYFAKSIGRMLEYYSQFNPSPLSIKQFIDFGLNATERTSFNFLRLELPVRLANIMAEIQLLPEHLLAMPSSKMVHGWYERSFLEILDFQKADSNDPSVLSTFLDTLVKIRNRHSSVVETMAQGVIELKESKNVDAVTENAIQYFLDRFYMSRISIRMLINQHTLLFGGDLNSLHSNIGCIDTQCSIVNIIHDAFENARFLCEQYYLTSPELVVRGVDGKEPKDLQLVYVPSHLYHIFFELFKNALRAVVEHHGSGASEYPPIDVRISLGKEDLCIKMSDLGGGIPRSALDLLFAYTYSTAPQPSPSGSGSAPLAGGGTSSALQLLANQPTSPIHWAAALRKTLHEVCPSRNDSVREWGFTHPKKNPFDRTRVDMKPYPAEGLLLFPIEGRHETLPRPTSPIHWRQHGEDILRDRVPLANDSVCEWGYTHPRKTPHSLAEEWRETLHDSMDCVPLVNETVGYGYGLPLSRLYARYFRGDLLVTSMDGYGTDALVYLKALSSEANELLPIFNKATSKNYETSVQTSDWSVPGQFFSHVRHFSTAMPNAVPRRLIV